MSETSKLENDNKISVGKETEGGITSSYAVDDGVVLKVPYSFFGSIYDENEEKAVLAAMHKDSLTMGPKVQEFQNMFKEKLGVKHALAVSNCTTGLHVIAQAIGLRPGDEVITTPNTFVATSLAIVKEGATPVYADIDPKTFNIDPKSIEKLVTNRTKAIFVVHYGGQVCDMDPIMDIANRYHLIVVEDCAHAPGATYKGRQAGSIGDFGSFSFHSLKNITTLGEGGMVTCNNDRWAEAIDKLRCMGNYDWEEQTDYWIPSHFDNRLTGGKWANNYRMNECQGAVGVEQMKKLEMMNEIRIKNGRYITEGIRGIKGITPVYEDPNCRHIYHLYTVCVEEAELGASRDDFLRVLYKEEGVQGILHYQPTYDFSSFRQYKEISHCPNADAFFYKRELNTPHHPRLTKDDLDNIIAGIKNAAEKVRK